MNSVPDCGPGPFLLGQSLVCWLQLFLNRDETSNVGLSPAGHSITLIGQGGLTTALLELKDIVKQVVVLEVLRRSLSGRYPFPGDLNEQVVQYNTLLNHRIAAAVPHHTHWILSHHHQSLVNDWHLYLMTDGVQLNDSDMSKSHSQILISQDA